MSFHGMMDGINIKDLSPKVYEHEGAHNCLTPMGIMSENVAEKYGISRERQDKMAFESHKKAAYAQKIGWL